MHKKYTRITAVIGLIAYPLSALALGTISGGPSIAGLGFDVYLNGGPALSDVQIVVTDPEGAQNAARTKTDSAGSATVHVSGQNAETAGTYSVRALTNGAETAMGSIQVQPDSMDATMSTVTTLTPYIQSNGKDPAKIAVRIKDTYGNPLSGRPVTLVSGRTNDVIEALMTETDATGQQHFTVTTTEAGTMQLRAIDLLSGKTVAQSVRIEAQSPYGTGGYDPYYQVYQPSNQPTYQPAYTSPYAAQVTPYRAQAVSGDGFDIIERLIVTAPATVNVGEDVTKLSVRAVDRNGNTVETYRGTIRFVTPNDPNATVPNFGSYTFRERDFGEMTFPLALRFSVGGVQTIRIEDQNDPRIYGEATINVAGGGGGTGQQAIEITSHMDGDYVNAENITIEGRAPRYVNLIVMGGMVDAYGSSDDQGFFSIPVSLNPGLQNFSIRVQDDARRYDSGQIVLTLDRDVPAIETITFSPEEPQEGEDVLVVVQSEPGLAQVLFTVLDRVNGSPTEITLAESPASPGTYQGFFRAPAAERYQPTITVLDKAGNVDEVKTVLTIGSQTVPTVQNVKAVPRVDAVELTWDAIPGDVTGYRVYVGEDPDDFSYALDTGRVITKATVKGLALGQTHYFAVTALQGDKESAEKSETISSQVLGFTLTVTPEDSALNVEWASLSTNLPLSNFILLYGAEKENLTEQRTINGQLRNYTIRDLLNGVEYFIAITPVSVTGEELTELTADASGTPSGSGFNPGPRDDVPFGIGEQTPPTIDETPHGSAPSTPASGIPPFAWMSATALGTLGVLWKLRRQKHARQSDAFMRAIAEHYKQS